MPIKPELSKKLLELKEESGLTFKQIGDEVGSSEANVRRYIMGETKAPDRPLLVAIIKAMGGDPAFILPKADAPAGAMDIGIYEKVKSDFERQLALWNAKHEKEVENIRHATDLALQHKDEWLHQLKAELDTANKEIDNLKRTRRRLLVVVSILSAVLVMVMFAHLFLDSIH